MEGSDVRKLQEKLKAAGFAISVADGIFGSGTDKAVKEFQKQKGLVADGIIGSKTLEQLALTVTKIPKTTRVMES